MAHLHTEMVLRRSKNELLSFVTAWMELENVMLSEISQWVQNKYHMISPISGFFFNSIGVGLPFLLIFDSSE